MEYKLARNPFCVAPYHLNMSTRYWLLKAEPDSRLVKGRDVKVTHIRFLLPPIFHSEAVQRGRFRTYQDVILGRSSQLRSEESDERNASWGKGENSIYG